MRSWIFYLVLLIVLCSLFALRLFFSGLPFAEAAIESLSPLQEKQLELFRESNSLLSTLATAAIGAIGALLFNRYKDEKVPPLQRVRAIASILLSAISIYCGLFAHDSVLWMLQNHIFNVSNPRVFWSGQCQTWSFLLALLVLADFFYQGIQAEPGSAATKTKAIVGVVGAGLLTLCGLSVTSQGQVRHEVTIQENLRIQDEVQSVIQRWMDATGVQVKKEAQAKIAAGFSDEQPRLLMAYEKQNLHSAQEKSAFADTLVEQYLYDIRDRKIAKSSRATAAPVGNRSYSFGPPQGATELVIELQDVLDFSPSTFLKGFRLIFDTKVGHLDVISEPDEAGITIDGDKKDEFTCRTFVVSPGDHTVDVFKPRTPVNCSEKVTVVAGAAETVVCPKGKPFSCRLPGKSRKK
jgi:hypothetical protein